MLIAQITDCHVVEPGGLVADRVDTAAGLRRAIDVINAMEPRPDVVLATGDLVNDGRREQYEHLVGLLAELEMPVYPCPGNHDDRSLLRSAFAGVVPAGPPPQPIDYVVGGEVRLIGLDTTIPGRHDGRVTTDQMAWLDDRLGEAPAAPTIIFQHHPPFESGMPAMDRHSGFTGAELERTVVARHAHVEAIVCGHLHRTMHRRFGGTIATVWPSTGPQLALSFVEGPMRYTSEPAGIALHRWVAGSGLTSHLVPVVESSRWVPSWALDTPTGS
jgi:3',5'-cyclic AMP phosphodiesterase CpdA